ncbi:MAG: EamA family transporter [Candidatus Pacebacteria bacterium]|nr:EamA family transporter [Candidatus Paceibacterota bacterium]
MQLWIIIAVFAHFLNAITAIIDKHIVSNKVMKPVVYAFYSGVFQILYLLAIPVIAIAWPESTFRFPSWELFGLAAFCGALFIFTLTIFYKAIKLSEVSRVTPVVGISVPVFTYILSFLLWDEALSSGQMIAFTLFVIGGFLMSAKIKRGKITRIKGMALAVFAGFLFASYYVIMDFLFTEVGFLDVFMILQFGGFLGSVLLLLSPQNRKDIFGMKDEENDVIENKASAMLFIYDKVTAAIAALLLAYAISIGNVVIINSLQATQYAFVLIMAVILSKKLPKLFHEQVEDGVIIQKVIALIFIAIGLFLIA